MCEQCRWNDHDACQGWLGQRRQMRCLCRTCLDQRLAKAPTAADDARSADVQVMDAQVTDVTEGAELRCPPRLVLIRGGGQG